MRYEGFEEVEVEVDSPSKAIVEIVKVNPNISFYRIAKELGITPSNINYYMSGDTKTMSPKVIEKLYERFGVKL